MSRFTMTVAPAGAFLAGALLAGVLVADVGVASAQTAPAGFGQRTSGGSYVPSTNDPGCIGLICNPLPSVSGPGRTASSPSDIAPPPACQGLICSLTPYGMQRPYTAADAAAAERARAAAQAQAAAQPAEPMAPTRRGRKARKAKVAKVARTPAPAESEAAK